MGLNVHQVHIDVNGNCARAAIARIHQGRDNLCMPGKRRNFLREWRRISNRTLEQVAEQLHMTHGNLSKIERGLVPWNEDLLDALADLYGCEPVDLLIRDPSDPEGIWSIWDNAKPGERRQIVAIAEAVVRGRAVGE